SGAGGARGRILEGAPLAALGGPRGHRLARDRTGWTGVRDRDQDRWVWEPPPRVGARAGSLVVALPAKVVPARRGGGPVCGSRPRRAPLGGRRARRVDRLPVARAARELSDRERGAGVLDRALEPAGGLGEDPAGEQTG